MRTRRGITTDSQTAAGLTETHKVGQRMEIAWELDQEFRGQLLEGHDLDDAPGRCLVWKNDMVSTGDRLREIGREWL
jgi:hypothetical protein